MDYDEQPSLEQALDVFHSEDDRAIAESAVEEALETGESFDVEARFPRPCGDIGWLRVQGDPEIEEREVDTVFDDARTDLQFGIDETDARITVEEIPTVVGDANQLRQVFQN